MSGLFHRLASRAMGNAATAEPIVPSLFAPVPHTGHLEMTSERAEVAIRPANVPSTLPSIQPSPAGKAVHEAFEANHSHDREPNPSVEPHTVQAIERTQTQPATPAPRRALPQSLNSKIPRQDAPDVQADRPAPRPSAQFIPSTAASQQSPPRPARREADQPDSSSANVIRVSIGRIDVRAELAAPTPAPAPRQRPSGMSLDEYARLRAEGKR
jgi:hypothetical protein